MRGLSKHPDAQPLVLWRHSHCCVVFSLINSLLRAHVISLLVFRRCHRWFHFLLDSSTVVLAIDRLCDGFLLFLIHRTWFLLLILLPSLFGAISHLTMRFDWRGWRIALTQSGLAELRLSIMLLPYLLLG